MDINIIFNSIEEQLKGPTSKIESKEWNFIVNSLRIQGNKNAVILKEFIESGGVSLEELKEYIDEVMGNGFKHKHPISDIIGLQEELDEKSIIKVSETKPLVTKPNNHWYKVTETIEEETNYGPAPFIDTEPTPDEEIPYFITEPTPDEEIPYIETKPMEEI